MSGTTLLSDTILKLNRVHNSLYAISTLMYLLLVQVRFRVIKNILPYRDLWDHAFMCVTIIIWSLTTLLFGIILFDSVAPKISLAFSALWTFYALVVDNILSWLFLYNLFKCRARVSNSKRLKSLWTKSVYGLGILCATTWVSLLLLLLAIFKFSDASFGSTRALLYRIAYAFSPIQFSGTLLFIYAVQLLFEDDDIHSNSKECPQKRTSSLPENRSFSSPTELDDDCDLVYSLSSSPTPSDDSTLYGVNS